MKIECTTEKLRGAITTASRFTERRGNLPVLKAVLLIAEGKLLTVRATNLECGIETVIPARVESSGIVAVPGDVIGGLVANLLGGASVTLELVGDVLSVKAAQVEASLKTLPADEFPILPSVSAENSFRVRGDHLARAVRSVAFCASLANIKPELQSVLLFGEASKLYTVATDSFRLAEKTTPVKGLSSVPQLLLPLKNAAELAKLLDGVSEEVDVYYNEHQLSLRFDGLYYTSRLIDGTFPNYRSIIPSSHVAEAVVLREDFAQAFKILSLFSDKFSQVGLAADPKTKVVALSARNTDVGENTTTLKATVGGEEIHMAFNGRYLADGLQGINGESVKMGFAGVGRPLTLSGVSDASFVYIVMPMNR